MFCILQTIIMNTSILFFIILIIGQHGSSVLCVLETETFQLDLRNNLDIMTKDLITRGLVEDNAYHSYVFHSGIGNREELKVTSFTQNNAFLIGHGIEEWQTLSSGVNIYMLGRTTKAVSLIIASRELSVNISSQSIELPPNSVPTASTIFERWNQNNKTMEVIIVIAVNTSTYDLLWYKLNSNKLIKFWSWSRYKPVSCMVVFTIGRNINLITVNTAKTNHSTTADVYDIALKKFDFRLTHSLLLDESCTSIEIGVIGKETYLFIPQTKLGILLVFKYDMSRDNGYFQRNINITSPRVTRAHWFTTASQNYIAVNGESPCIYRMKQSGEFVNELETYLKEVEDWLIVPVSTYRSEVIILVKQRKEVTLLVWKGVGKGFSEGSLPVCDPNEGSSSSCLDGRFTGAIAVLFHNIPSILLPTNSNHSKLYHVITSLDKVKDPISSEIFHLKEKKIFIQDVWKRQKKIGEEIKDQLSHSIKTNVTNTISAKWTVESLETPVLIESGKVTHSVEYSSQPSSFSEDANLNSLKDKINKANEKISRLKNQVDDAVLSNWDLKDFNGKVIFKGAVSIKNLTLLNLNGKDVNNILQNSLRLDRPKRISGSKVVPRVQAENVSFDKLNDLISSQLSYADEPITLAGNVTFVQNLVVQDSVVLPSRGLINGIDFSEELCRVNESCPVTVKFENLTVKNSIAAEKVNSEYLEKNPSKWPVVYAGKCLTIGNINGKNLSQIMNRVVYTDRITYIPETTIVNDTIFSEQDLTYKNLIDLSKPYSPEFRTSGKNETVENVTQFKNNSRVKAGKSTQDVSPTGTSAAGTVSSDVGVRTSEETAEEMFSGAGTGRSTEGIKNQKIDMVTLLMDPNAEVTFINAEVEVLGKILSDEALNSNSWADDLADVILVNETEVSVSGIKTFKSTVDIKKDFQVTGLVGGINISQVMTVDTDQVLHDIRTLHGKIIFDNVALSGDWDGVNVTALDAEAVRLSGDQILPSLQLIFNETTTNIETEMLTITDYINNMNVHDIITEENTKGELKMISLSANNITVLGDVNIIGKVCGWNLTELDQQRFSLSQGQNITGIFRFNEMIVKDVLEVQQANQLNISSLNNVLTKFSSNDSYSDMIISELRVNGNVNTSKGMIAGYDLIAIARDAILLTGNNDIKTELVFEDLLTCNMLDVHNYVGGLNWTQFTQDVVYRGEKPVVIEGKKTFMSGFHVTGELEVEKINGRKIQDILTTSTVQNITGNLTILGDLEVINYTDLLGTLNGRNITELASRCYIPEDTDSILCTGNINFEDVIHVNNLFVGKSLNNINFNKFVSSIVYKNSTSAITGTKVFTNDITFTDLSLSKLNDQNFDKFLEDIVLMEPDVEIIEHITFVEDVKVLENIVVDYNLDAPIVNSCSFQEWSDNAVYLDKNMSVTGLKQFESASGSGDINTHYFGDLNMLDGSIILLKKEQTLSGTLKLKQLTSFNDVPVGHKVNNMRLDKLFKNTLMTNWNQVVESEIIFTEDIVIEGNLTTLGDVNDRDLKKLVTLHTNQTLSGNYIFDCLTLLNDVNTSNIISGINITEWHQRAVTLDTDQEISGSWRIEDDVKFIHPVEGLVNLGDVNLQELKDQIKTHILGRELEMKKNLTSLCNGINVLIDKTRRQETSLLFFETSQNIELTKGPFNPYYFQAYDEHYLLISKHNCSCKFYKWNNKTLQFSSIFEKNLGYFTHWVLLKHNNLVYALSLSDESNTYCQYLGLHLWLFANNTLEHIMPLQINATDVRGDSSLQNVFYTVNSLTVKKWSLKNNKEGMVVTPQDQEWVINITGNIRFLDSRTGLGLVVSNGSSMTALTPSNTLPHDFFLHSNKEMSSNNNQGFVAIASWEDTEVKRHSDFVKIYKLNGHLYDKLLTKRPSQLNWFYLQGSVWLAFIENSTTLQVYQLQDVFRGFQQKLSLNLQTSGLIVTSLPIHEKWNASPYFILYSNTSVQLIETSVLGDPYIGPNLSCNFEKSMSLTGR